MTIAEQMESKLKQAFSVEDDTERAKQVALSMVIFVRDVTGMTRIQNGMDIFFNDGSTLRIQDTKLTVLSKQIETD